MGAGERRANQPLSGQLILSDQTPTPVANRLVRIATHWKIVKAHTYDDSGGPIYSTSTDASGNFKVSMPPGQNYLVTWWDPSRKTFEALQKLRKRPGRKKGKGGVREPRTKFSQLFNT